MNWIATATREDYTALPIALGDTLAECRELAADWLSHLDPNNDPVPVEINFFSRSDRGRYVLNCIEDPVDLP